MKTNIANIKLKAYEVCEIIEKKNHDYGDSFAEIWEQEGDIVGGIHIKEKANRIMQLVKGEGRVNESPDDALRDCAGYCLLMLDLRSQKNMEDEKDYPSTADDNHNTYSVLNPKH